MNCETCQRRLLASADPAAPAAAVRAHLAECPACRRRQRQLLRLERHVPRLPVPPSRGKNRLLNKLLIQDAPSPAPAPPPAPPVLLRPWWRRPRVLSLGAAAALLLACGLLLDLALLRRDQAADVSLAKAEEPEPDLVARLVECDARLAAAESPRRQVEELAEMADALRREGQALRRADLGEAERREVARLYTKVIREGVIARARALPAAERRQVLAPIATRLARAAREARRLADGHAAPAPLLQIAEAARDGDRQLRALMEVTQ
jgi:hypothetical protein